MLNKKKAHELVICQLPLYNIVFTYVVLFTSILLQNKEELKKRAFKESIFIYLFKILAYTGNCFYYV